MLLSIFPLPLDVIIFNVIAGLGAIMLVYGVFLEPEKRQDLVFLIASACLFVYAQFIENIVFSVAMAGLFIGSLIEFVEIMIGLHKHTIQDIEKYKNPR